MNHNFKIGDTVKLSLGSPRITIVNVEPDMIYGSYRESDNGPLQFGRWYHGALTLIRAVGTEYDLGEEPTEIAAEDDDGK